MLCEEVVKLVARRADGDASLEAAARAGVDAHLERCDACRSALDTQKAVSAFLRLRPVDPVSPAFAARLSARLDEESSWFGIADWRVWTLRLAPVALVLALATLFGSDASTQTPATLDEWTYAADSSSTAALMWQSDATPESVLETMLSGEMPNGGGGARDVR